MHTATAPSHFKRGHEPLLPGRGVVSALGVLPTEAVAPRPQHAVSPQAELCVPIKHWGDPSAGAAIAQRRASYGYDVHIVMSTKGALGAGAAFEQRRASSEYDVSSSTGGLPSAGAAFEQRRPARAST